MRTMNKAIEKKSASVKVDTTAAPINIDAHARAFVESLGKSAATMADRVRIVLAFREENPSMSANAAYNALQDRVEALLPASALRRTGYKRATLERLDKIGQTIQRHGWTLDGPTADALWNLLEKDRKGFNALLESQRKQTPKALERAFSAAEKADQERREAAKAARAANKDKGETQAATDDITPAALIASIRERVSVQTWTPEQIGAFVQGIREYADTLEPLTVTA